MVTKQLVTGALLVGVGLAGAEILGGQAYRGSSTSSIVGVWRVAETTTTGPNGRKLISPQPGMRIYTRRHYVDVTSDKPRPELPPQGKATDKQIADAYTGLAAQAGTYEIKGDDIIHRPVSAGSPNAMRPGSTAIWTFKLDGDTLTLTSKTNQDGPVANPITLKLTRVE